jgi:hypothetical protein
MRSKLVLVVVLLIFSSTCFAQVHYAAKRPGNSFSVGAGMDYWSADWAQTWKYGPAAWASTDLWHGLGLIAEGHGLMAGGTRIPQWKYFEGGGGAIYTYGRWASYRPFVKAEAGYAGLSFPRYSSTYSHDSRTTYSFGGGLERRTFNHLWIHADYTYDFFPDFFSIQTRKYHTLNPAGLTAGASWHFR